jgi:hypothetical protein
MNNLAHFPEPSDHKEQVSEAPDQETLQRLLGELVGALNPRPQQRGDREIRIRNFRSERLELVDDLVIVLEDRDGQYVANSYDTGQYGHGYSPDMAIHELCSVVEDYYDLLLEDEDRLNDHLAAHLRYLKSILRVRG